MPKYKKPCKDAFTFVSFKTESYANEAILV